MPTHARGTSRIPFGQPSRLQPPFKQAGISLPLTIYTWSLTGSHDLTNLCKQSQQDQQQVRIDKCRACMTRTPPKNPTASDRRGSQEPGEGILRHAQGQDKTSCRTCFTEVSGLTAHLRTCPDTHADTRTRPIKNSLRPAHLQTYANI